MTNDLERKKNIQDDEISLKDLILKVKAWWFYLWSKKWVIILVGVIGGILGGWYAFNRKPVYIATTTFVLENSGKGGSLGAYAGIASMMGVDLGGGGGGIFQGDNILDLYKSRKMIEKTLFSGKDKISEISLLETYLEINKVRDTWTSRPDLKALKFTRGNLNVAENILDEKIQRLRDSIIGLAVEDIGLNYLKVAKPGSSLSKIQIDVKSSDEMFSKRFNEELVKNVNDFYVQTKTKKSLENVAILQHKTDSVRAVMNSAINRAVAVSDATPNMNMTRQVQRVAPVQRSQFSAEASKAVLVEMEKNLEMSKMALLNDTPLIEVIDGPIYPLKMERFGKAKGILLGGFVFGILAVFLLTAIRLFKFVINN